MLFTTSAASVLLLAGSALAAPKNIPRDYESGLPPIVPYNTRSGNEAIIQQLLTAPTQVDRFKILNQPGDFVFDFNNDAAVADSETRGAGGFTVAATAKTFPALIGNDIAMTLGFLGPCSINTPHVHPRATEINVIVEGRLVTNFVPENGVDAQANLLSQYQMSVFPRGAIHTEFNPDCTDAVFVAGFNNADPGVSQIAQNFFGLREDVVQSALGVQTINGQDIESFREALPANVAQYIDTCLDRCGIQRAAKRDLSTFV